MNLLHAACLCFKGEAEYGACALGGSFAPPVRWGGICGGGWPPRAHEGLAGQELHHLFGVADVAGHAQAEGLDALQDEPGAVRAHAGAEVAQAFATGARRRRPGAFLAEVHVVKALVRAPQL